MFPPGFPGLGVRRKSVHFVRFWGGDLGEYLGEFGGVWGRDFGVIPQEWSQTWYLAHFLAILSLLGAQRGFALSFDPKISHF